jgi:hypothetical protein
VKAFPNCDQRQIQQKKCLRDANKEINSTDKKQIDFKS